MNLLKRVPVLWKVLFAPAIAIVCMAAYLAFTASVSKQNNRALVDARDVQYPVLDAMTENTGALDKIIDILNSAALAGEPEQLPGADTLAVKVRENYARLSKLDAPHAADLQRLAAEFDVYYVAARDVANTMAQHTGLPAKDKVQRMAATWPATARNPPPFPAPRTTGSLPPSTPPTPPPTARCWAARSSAWWACC